MTIALFLFLWFIGAFLFVAIFERYGFTKDFQDNPIKTTLEERILLSFGGAVTISVFILFIFAMKIFNTKTYKAIEDKLLKLFFKEEGKK